MEKPRKSKLEYSEEFDTKEVDAPESIAGLPIILKEVKENVSFPPSTKKARSDAQKAVTARMRVKLDERRKELIVIKQEAKETALLQQMELKTLIKDKLKAKQLKTKADEKMRQMLLEASESDEEESESESEPEIVYRKPTRKGPIKQLPSFRKPSYASQEFPTVRFV